MHPGTAVQSNDGGKRASAIGLGQIALDAVASNEPARNEPLRGAFKLYALQTYGPCVSHQPTCDVTKLQHCRSLARDCSRQCRLLECSPAVIVRARGLQFPRPRRLSHDIAEVSIPIRHARD